MRWLRAIGFSTFTILQVLGSPILFNYYQETLNIEQDSMIGIFIFATFYFILLFIVSVLFYISAIIDKDIKDFKP